MRWFWQKNEGGDDFEPEVGAPKVSPPAPPPASEFELEEDDLFLATQDDDMMNLAVFHSQAPGRFS